MVTTTEVATKYEIWVYARPDHRECVRECGLFDSERDAVHAASRLRNWLHTGVISEQLFVNCVDADDRTALLTMGDYLRDIGIDPTRTLISARPLTLNDNAESDIEPHWRVDEGHGARGPLHVGFVPSDPDDDDDDDSDLDSDIEEDPERTRLEPRDVAYELATDNDVRTPVVDAEVE